MTDPHDAPLRLRLAAEAAVSACREDHRSTLRQAAGLQGRLETGRRALEEAAMHPPAEESAAEAFASAIENARSAIAAAESDLAHHLALRERTSGTLVVSMFGKTHAGKSLLAEALLGGDGSTVSTGRTGFTDTVSELTPPLTVLDCPGFGPPGPERERHDAAARDGVLQSDVVLLVFRGDQQKAEEFKQIADWVNRYDKPVVAVLNIFNSRWNCLLPSIGMEPRRLEKLDRTVGEHVSHIERQMARVGLRHVPVLVTSAQRAHFARHGSPYRGPNAVECSAWRAELSRDEVADAANLLPLEEMLLHLVEQHGASLRREALAGDLRGAARRVVDAIHPVLALAEKERDTFVEHFDELLGWCGDPRHDDALRAELDRKHDGASTVIRGAAKTLELTRRRGACGLARESETLFLEHPGRVVRAAHGRIGMTTDRAIRDGGLTSRQAMASLRIDPDLGTAQKAWRDALGSHVDGTLARWSRTLGEDLQAAHADAVEGGFRDVSVGSDFGLAVGDWLSRALNVVGAFLGPWGIAASVVASITGWLFRRSRKKREAKRRRAIHDSLSAAIQRVERECRKTTGAELLELRAAVLAHVGTDFAALARGRATCAETLRTLVEDLGLLAESDVTAGGEQALGDAIRHVLRRFDGGPAEVFHARRPRGVSRATRRRSGRPPRRAPSAVRPMGEPSAGRVTEALAEARRRIAADPELAALMTVLDDLPTMSTQAATLALVGDYSVGKTSLVRRLCVDLGLGDAGAHAVGGAPTTSEVTALLWDPHTRLLDAPGFHGGDPSHDARARHAARRATALVLVVPPGVASAGDDEVRPLLGWRGPVPPAPVHVVIGRSDELGVSPDLDPVGFARRVQCKREEASEHLEIHVDRIHAVAADPFGLADDAAGPGAFDDYRSWDGMAALVAAMDDESARQREAGPALAQLRHAAHDLLDAADAADRRRAIAEDREKLAARIRDAWSTAVRRLKALEKAIPSRLEDALRPFLAEHLAAVESAEDPETLRDAVERAENWAAGADGAIETVWNVVHADVDAILDDCARTVDEALESPLGRRVRRAHAAAPDVEVPGSAAEIGTLFDLLGKTAKGAGKAFGKDMKQVREAVLKVGHSLGKKFRPWEATRYAQHLGKAGKVLRKLGPVLAVVGEIVDLVQSGRAAKRFRAARENAREVLTAALVDVAADLAHASPDGLTTTTAAVRRELSARRNAARRECAALHRSAESGRQIGEAARLEAARLARLLPAPAHTPFQDYP